MDVDEVLREFAAVAHDDVATLLLASSRAVGERALASLDPEGSSGVRLAHVPVMAALRPNGTRITELAQTVGVTRQAIAQLVAGLEHAGLVSLGIDPEDHRATLVHLTERGAAFCAAAIAFMREREAQWRATYGDGSIDELKQLLRAIASED